MMSGVNSESSCAHTEDATATVSTLPLQLLGWECCAILSPRILRQLSPSMNCPLLLAARARVSSSNDAIGTSLLLEPERESLLTIGRSDRHLSGVREHTREQCRRWESNPQV